MKLFKKRLNKKQRIESLEHYMDQHIIPSYNNLIDDFNDLRNELATNGVVRRQRELEKENRTLRDAISGLSSFVTEKFTALDSNGVATAINKLNDEVFKERKEVENKPFYWSKSFLSNIYGGPFTAEEAPTLAGKVEAILQHLKLNVEVAPEEVKEAKPVAKKKPVSKKKGRR